MTARSSFDRLLPAQRSVKAGPRVTVLSRNLAAGSAFAMLVECGWLDHQTHGGEHGTVLATRSALNESNRPVPCARTAAQETVVRRAVASAHARALRGDLDCR